MVLATLSLASATPASETGCWLMSVEWSSETPINSDVALLSVLGFDSSYNVLPEKITDVCMTPRYSENYEDRKFDLSLREATGKTILSNDLTTVSTKVGKTTLNVHGITITIEQFGYVEYETN